MKTLIYGFKPFGSYSTNTSQQLISLLPMKPGIITHIFPTKFDSQQFIDVVDELKPTYILGLGQYPKGEKLRIERKSTNHQQLTKSSASTPINPQGPSHLHVNWHLQPDDNSWVSYKTGRYVCNFSMYHLSMWTIKHNKQFAFLHIPINANLKLARQFILKNIKA